MPWCADGPKEVGINSLTANIFCQGHNSQLSALDTLATRFLEALQEAELDLQRGSSKDRTHTFNGLKLERWFLKVCYTMWASENFGHRGVKLPGSPPDAWDDYLLGTEPLPPHWGLYVPMAREAYPTVLSEFEVIPISGSDGSGIIGAHFKLASIPFTLILGKPDDPSAWGIYRPRELIFHDNRFGHFLRLAWPEGEIGSPIQYIRLGPSPDLMAALGRNRR